MPKPLSRRKTLDLAHFLKTGALFIAIVGLLAAGVLAKMSADPRQQAAGFNTYDACDYGNNNGQAICLDSEYGQNNCVMCVNGEKHILPDSECAPNLCSAPQGPTCSDGTHTYTQGGTACRSETECVSCNNGHWETTDRANCTGVCGFTTYEGQGCYEQGDSYCDQTDKAVLRCGADLKWHTYRTCGPGAECEFLGGPIVDCVATVNSTDAGKACNPKLNTTRCASDRQSVMRCNNRTRKWEVAEQCEADGICFFADTPPHCDNEPANG